MDDRVPLHAPQATVGEGAQPSLWASAGPGALASALKDGPTWAERDDAEAFGSRKAGICEGALPVAALPADRVVLHGACDRCGSRPGLLHRHRAGGNDAGDEQEERCGVGKNASDHHIVLSHLGCPAAATI